ncbi:MAG: hypothetical protein SVZ03_09835 [Spirochaetota bacterium]|nr:hypothetical protein [Spirochaetota bacterium]
MGSKAIVRIARIKDKEEIFNFISKNWKERSPYQIPERWEWLFIKNPFIIKNYIKLPLPIWIAKKNNQIVGHTAAMIVPLKLGKKIYTASWSINTLVLSEFRGESIGYNLQKANQESAQIFMSLGMSKANRSIKHKLGGIDGPPVFNYFLRQRWTIEKISNALLKRLNMFNKFGDLIFIYIKKFKIIILLHYILNLPLKIRLLYYKIKNYTVLNKSGISISEIERFADLLDKDLIGLMKPYKFAVNRTSEYLNWKFVDQPHLEYRIFLATKGENVLGYTIIRVGQKPHENNNGIILELMADLKDNKTMYYLLNHVLSIFTDAKTESSIISTSISEIEKVIKRFGYKKRSETIPVIYISDDIEEKKLFQDKTSWLFSYGDHDLDQFPNII